MSEAEFLAAVRDLCRFMRLAIYHTYSSKRSEPGFPDCVIVGPGGVLFRELKAERGRLTPAQTGWIDALRAAGADAGVWRPSDLGGVIADELRALRRAA